MSETLRSVGLDVGTTSTQLVVSELTVENRASGFSVPEMEITDRKILYKSPVHFTPLLDESHMDGEKLRILVQQEYQKAGIRPETVDTGAIIVTGETSRKENARRVLDALSDMAGDFVVAAAGPDLESVLAARGAGADAYSADTGKKLLHMDIGGGTSNLALIQDGRITHTGCLNVGGRLVKYDEQQVITYVSPVLEGLFPLAVGQVLGKSQAEELAQMLVQALEMAAGIRPWDSAGESLLTKEAFGIIPELMERPVISFSGGVADCIETEYPWTAFGDIGPLLGQAIRASGLCRGEYLLGKETIRATVIGAGCHATQLSGSTVFHRNVRFPLKNIPVVPVEDPENLGRIFREQEGPVVLALKGEENPCYARIRQLAQGLVPELRDPVLLCLEQDMAKALGQALAARLPPDMPILCIDRIRVREGDYLDIGTPVGGAMPVVVKTLVMGKENKE